MCLILFALSVYIYISLRVMTPKVHLYVTVTNRINDYYKLKSWGNTQNTMSNI